MGEENGDQTEQTSLLQRFNNLLKKTSPPQGNDEYADEEWFGVGGTSFSPDIHEER